MKKVIILILLSIGHGLWAAPTDSARDGLQDFLGTYSGGYYVRKGVLGVEFFQFWLSASRSGEVTLLHPVYSVCKGDGYHVERIQVGFSPRSQLTHGEYIVLESEVICYGKADQDPYPLMVRLKLLDAPSLHLVRFAETEGEITFALPDEGEQLSFNSFKNRLKLIKRDDW